MPDRWRLAPVLRLVRRRAAVVEFRAFDGVRGDQRGLVAALLRFAGPERARSAATGRVNCGWCAQGMP
ncbi:hypothetical protein [Streptomyces sp. NPDC002573]|uniref:hypothetical protein n=1 Tax=Streptomyces sp. NPDC002573 TaxID=3364651 RepID=UPI00367DFD0C